MTRTSEAGKLICDCGCGGALTEKQVAAGRRFVYGHKPVTIARIKKDIIHRAPRTGPAVEVNLKLMATFVDTQLKTLKQQRDLAVAERDRAVERFTQLEHQVAAWEAVYTALIGIAVAE